jgi:hypothetical protein
MKREHHEFKVGDAVSYGFNGDWYPDGEVARITKNFLITTTGNKYHIYSFIYRKLIKDSNGRTVDSEDVMKDGFKSVNGGTWKLAKGVIREWNPEF